MAEILKIKHVSIVKHMSVNEDFILLNVNPTEVVLVVINTNAKSAVYIASRSLSGYGFYTKINGELDSRVETYVDNGTNGYHIVVSEDVELRIRYLYLKK